MYRLLRKILFLLPPEVASTVALKALAFLVQTQIQQRFWPGELALPCRVMGIDFPNPVGLAAGFDKSGDHIRELAALGFGFIEVGTITPMPQPGNPKPRLFRLPRHQALINRMGFNNLGMDHLCQCLESTRFSGVLGINIGKNWNTPLAKAVDDYLAVFQKVYAWASYVTINLSSPNTPGLRQLQQQSKLNALLSALSHRRQELVQASGRYVPIVVKISPDLTDTEIKGIATQLLSCHVDGVIATNTTISRTAIQGDPLADESGGLSGKPLRQRATAVVHQLNQLLKGKLPIIAVGGIMTAQDAMEKIQAGASLIQIYTGLIYNGPGLVAQIVTALKQQGVLSNQLSQKKLQIEKTLISANSFLKKA